MKKDISNLLKRIYNRIDHINNAIPFGFLLPRRQLVRSWADQSQEFLEYNEYGLAVDTLKENFIDIDEPFTDKELAIREKLTNQMDT